MYFAKVMEISSRYPDVEETAQLYLKITLDLLCLFPVRANVFESRVLNWVGRWICQTKERRPSVWRLTWTGTTGALVGTDHDILIKKLSALEAHLVRCIAAFLLNTA